MKNSKGIKSGEKSATLEALRACGPVAKGSIAEVRMKCAKLGCAACRDGRGRPAWIFTYHEGGRRKFLYVRQRDIGTVREALERGRLVETLLNDCLIVHNTKCARFARYLANPWTGRTDCPK